MAKYIAQIDAATNIVMAVTEMNEPVAPPPNGMLFVEIDGLLSIGGKLYSGGEFIDKPHDPAPKVYDKAGFKEFCYGVLGTLAVPSGTVDEKMLAGITAMGGIMRGMSVSADDAVHQCFVEYTDADHLEKSKTMIFLGILAAASIIAAEQLGALNKFWEET